MSQRRPLMDVSVPVSLIRDRRVTNAARSLFLHLAVASSEQVRRGEDESVLMSVMDLCELTGMADTTVRKAATNLAETGWIEREPGPRYAYGSPGPTRYLLRDMPKSTELAA